MLRVSTRGEYGVRLMVDLARHYGGRPRSLAEISQAEGLEMKVQDLEQLVKGLREHNLVESTRGAHGGYRLARAPELMRIGERGRPLGGPMAPTISATAGRRSIEMRGLASRGTKYLWRRLPDT